MIFKRELVSYCELTNVDKDSEKELAKLNSWLLFMLFVASTEDCFPRTNSRKFVIASFFGLASFLARNFQHQTSVRLSTRIPDKEINFSLFLSKTMFQQVLEIL